jgi:hypothetical protein
MCAFYINFMVPEGPERMDIEDLAERARPCSTPEQREQIKDGDFVVALISLATKVAIRYVFKHVYVESGKKINRELVNLKIWSLIPEAAEREARHEACIDAIYELSKCFEEKLDGRAIRALSAIIIHAVLEPDDPERKPPLPDNDQLISDLESLMRMDLADFDAVGRVEVNDEEEADIDLVGGVEANGEERANILLQ